ncbi:Peptidylprolyl isomerase [Thalassoporum mexicanum PCC 7367]|uniref:peptidylprolyl isomerase n=1 Tax=Thalassoporum mexicanum TaxID=3457544 RepID=UPI00029FC2B2|nr:peptidylprolyl isomerase [Pseudanabaena sp. PCC 7367]AFY69353.1 Peptidylprolyl isomerase [Pseudanabaena sp. PCC 7367]
MAIAIAVLLSLAVLVQPLAFAFAATEIPITLGIHQREQPLIAALPSKSAIKDADTLLRNALPIKNEQIRKIQSLLEAMPKQANLKRWRSLGSEIVKITNQTNKNKDKILASVPAVNKDAATQDLENLLDTLTPLREAIESQNRDGIKAEVENALSYVGKIEADMVAEFPFTVPAKYDNFPQLKGRALVELTTELGKLDIVVDGYSSPVNGGQFVDLVQQGFYDGLSFNRADDNYFLQAGDPPGDADGYVDPKTGEIRTVPLEIKIPTQDVPIYEFTLSDVGEALTLPVLPFSVFGTVAMARPPGQPNGASSQFFIYLFDSDLTPAGLNLIDGNFTVIGYVVEGDRILPNLKLGDKIVSMKVLSGAENLVQPKS